MSSITFYGGVGTVTGSKTNNVTVGSPHLARLNFLAVDARVGGLRFAGVLVIGTDSVKGNSKGVQSIGGLVNGTVADSINQAE